MSILPSERPPLLAVGLVSAAALAYEVLLIRVFALVHWHHAVETAISLALLGYGASGSLLALFGERLRRHAAGFFIANAMLFAVTVPLSVEMAQRLAFDPQAIRSDLGHGLELAALCLLLAVPLLAAANCIGMALWRFPARIPRIYGVDLLGAGAGAVLLLAGLWLASPAQLLLLVAVGGLLSAVAAAAALARRRHLAALAAVSVLGVLALYAALPESLIRPAPYKDLAQALSAHGAVTEQTLHGPAGSVSVVHNPEVPFRPAAGLSLQSLALPPAQRAVFVDGERVGSLPLANAHNVQYQRDRLTALPFLLRDGARTLVLNAGSGDAVRQAIALGAARVVAVEPNPQLVALACTQDPGLRPAAAGGCADASEAWIAQSARAYVAGRDKAFDLVRLDVAADVAGLDALQIDFDLTRQAISAYLDSLAADGLLAIAGSLRYPPGLSLRLLAAARDALGSEVAARQVAMLRGWRDFLLLVSPSPLSPADRAGIRGFADRLGFDLVWLPDIDAAEVNRFRQLPQAAYFRGARAVLAGESGVPVIQSVGDDRPYPYRFSGVQETIASLLLPSRSGNPPRAELDSGLIVGLVTLAVAVGGALTLIMLPLLLRRRRRETASRPVSRWRVLAYFGAIGLAFLFIEIAWIQRLRLFLGHPVHAATVVLATFLVCAGLGSLWAQRLSPAARLPALRGAVAVIALSCLLFLAGVPAWLGQWAAAPLPVRALVAAGLVAPLAFALGMPFPLGLARLAASAPAAVPWAWAVNGSASVISAALAPLLSATAGFGALILVALSTYLLIAWVQPVASPAPPDSGA
jgi:hypothetical protein